MALERVKIWSPVMASSYTSLKMISSGEAIAFWYQSVLA